MVDPDPSDPAVDAAANSQDAVGVVGEVECGGQGATARAPPRRDDGPMSISKSTLELSSMSSSSSSSEVGCVESVVVLAVDDPVDLRDANSSCLLCCRLSTSPDSS